MRLQKIDLPFREGLNVDFDVVAKGPLIFNVNIGSNIPDHLADLCVTWGGKHFSVHVDNEDDFMSIEHTVVHPGLSESYFLSFLGEVLVPHPRLLPQTIEVLEETEDIRRPASFIGCNALGNLCVHVKLYVGLRKGLYEVHLLFTAYVNDKNY